MTWQVQCPKINYDVVAVVNILNDEDMRHLGSAIFMEGVAKRVFWSLHLDYVKVL